MVSKEQEVFQVAEALYEQRPGWLEFFDAVLGIDGIARRVYPSPEQYNRFKLTDEYRRIQDLLDDLRRRGGTAMPPSEEVKVITVRLPKSLHDSLKVEAHEQRTSMNKLCIAKLLQELQNSVEEGAEGRVVAQEEDEVPGRGQVRAH